MTYPLAAPFEGYSLLYPLHEWVEIVVGKEGELFYVGGVRAPDGVRTLGVTIEHIACCPTGVEAVALGTSIANDAKVARGLLGMPGGCAFTSEL